MQSHFLVPETTVTEKGTGESIQLGESGGGTMLLTLGITDIVEQEALEAAREFIGERARAKAFFEAAMVLDSIPGLVG